MTNLELQKYLQRFPPSAPIRLKLGTDIEVKAVELAFDAAPVVLTEQNLAWADMVSEKIFVRLLPADGWKQEPPR